MNKNKFFEKVGKLTFSIVLTSILVVGFVGAATTWRDLNDNDTVSGTHWQNMVAEIDLKLSSVDLSNYYTKSEADTNFTSVTEAVNSVINTCKICIAHADYNNTPANWVCNGINDGAAKRKLSGDVGSDDSISVKFVCETGTWANGTLVDTITNCMPEMWAAKKTGSCTPGDTFTYYMGGTPSGCPSMGGGDPMMRGQKKYTQTCN